MEKVTRILAGAASMLAVASLAIGPALARQAPTDGPQDAFQGCEEVELAPATTADPAARLTGAPGGPVEVETTKKTRMLQGLPVDQATADDDKNQACWARLDGVWQDDDVVIIDPEVEATGWAADLPSLQTLAHGTYTEPGLLVVMPDTDPEQVLVLVDAFDPSRRTTFVSADDIPLSEVLKRGGKRKTYKARRDTGFGTDLKVDVSRQGYVRLRLGDRLFSRPSPGIIATVNANEYGLSDVFVYQSNLDNVMASRRGYDITTQDGFDLLNNAKLEVFKEVFGNQYRILEKRTVPLGFNLVPEVKQGMVYQRSFSSTEREIQSSVADTYGGKARIGLAPGDVEIGPSASAGADFAESIANSMRNSKSSSRATGYSRTKLYAIVVDHAYIELSDDFIDAIEDARRYGDTDIRYYDRIIEKFGTHYPYAVTYGANAEMAFTYSEKATYEREASESANRFEGELEMVKGSVSGYVGKAISSGRAESSSEGEERSTFQAVGGNGSWDQNGFAAGDRPAPILLDLRPLDQLLNPINFPGEPEVYEDVRAKLHKRLRAYSELRAAGLSNLPIYDTTLGGRYHTEAFPDLVFVFEEESYAESTLTVQTIGGRTFTEWAMLNRGRDAASIEPVKVPLKRTESGDYKAINHLRYEELYQQGAVSKRDYRLNSLDGRLRGRVRLSALPDGRIVFRNDVGGDAEERIELRRWTDAEDAKLDANKLDGAWRSEDWPGYVILSGERDGDFTSIMIATDEGEPATLACVPAGLESPKDRLDIANYSKLVFQGTDPLNGEHHLNPLQWALSIFFFAALDQEPAPDWDEKQMQAKEMLNCLFSAGSPLGSAPILAVDDDPEAILSKAPALPRLDVQGDGSLTLSFREPVELQGGPEVMMQDLSEPYWEPVGDTVALSPLPADEARALRRTYNDTIEALQEARKQAQEDDTN